MHLLDRLYQELDALATRHDLFKVETIGDSYSASRALAPATPRDWRLHAARFRFVLS